MLGFAPISGQSIAGSPFKLALVEAPMSASGGFAFGGTAFSGVVSRMTASGGITFAGTSTAKVKLYRSASGGITFSGSPILSLAGRPYTVTAVADPYIVQALRVNFEIIAKADNFTVSGGR